MELSRFDEYLGDGVYASFDGYQIWLSANHHENKVVALDPSVFRALVGYGERLERTLNPAPARDGES